MSERDDHDDNEAPGDLVRRITHDMDALLAQVGRHIERNDEIGEQMVRKWLDAQGFPQLRTLLRNNLRNRLFREIGKLEAAILARSPEDVRRYSHEIRGWSGTFKMSEIYEIVHRIDQRAYAEDMDFEALRNDAFELGKVLARIPTHYLVEESSSLPAVTAEVRDNASLDNRVLVVDDNEMNRALVATLLDRKEIEYDMAENGLQALERLRDRSYRLVLLDMEMPIMDGWTTVSEMRSDEVLKNVHVIALTAHALVGIAEKCRAAGCDDYLPKPLDKDLLYAKVNEVLYPT